MRQIGAALLLCAAASAAGQVTISGVVKARDGGAEAFPVAGALVTASKDRSPARAAEALTDSLGRYRISGLPEGRYTVAVQSTSYYVVKAGGVETESIVKACLKAGDCGETDFELARSSVVEGWVTDDFGDPWPGVRVSLATEGLPEPKTPEEFRARMAGIRQTDDRGYFRIWGVRPGRYELTIRPASFRNLDEGAERQRIEVAPGQQSVQARIAMHDRETESFTVRGVVKAETLESASMWVRPAIEDSAIFYWARGARIEPEGGFVLGDVPKGRFDAFLTRGLGSSRSSRYLGRITVDRDLDGVELTPQPPTGVRGRVELEGVPAGDRRLTVGWAHGIRYGSGFTELQARAPEYRFEDDEMAPGDYILRLNDPDAFIVDSPFFSVALGQMTELTVRISNEFASVRGRVRAAAEGTRPAAAHSVVGVRGERGTHTAKTDDEGRFVIEKVIPGEYEITAWIDAQTDAADAAAWERPGQQIRRLAAEPGFEAEVDLTVAAP
ncbi:MAG: carboxypeptidase regulatory-like domain-containing protein [Acidobacteria bacterium]|nr:carboxypeptidase regulatory-like domain-containing protein [Acidobacteriota bacterium]